MGSVRGWEVAEGADLHVHSSASDGRFPPREVIRRAYGAGLSAVALTDHDTVSGLEEAKCEADRLGITFVPGCEISVHLQSREIHLLAYYFDAKHPELLGLLSTIHEMRKERVRRIVRKLNDLGLPLQTSDVETEACVSASIGRNHVAKALVRKGLVASRREAFASYLGDGRSACVPMETPKPTAVLDIVWSVGGVPVIAHPGLYGLEDPEAFFRDWDLGGVEVGHPSQAADVRAVLKQWAAKRGLLVTGGSDWHGDESARLGIGCERVGLDLLDALRALRRSRDDPHGRRRP
ncbi:MAG: PHP domain-containing protein [Candidatus Eisenbacteria sp.]|nr:PHP domain-containing protein [Candidatus Eisenbacteria bacterium]